MLVTVVVAVFGTCVAEKAPKFTDVYSDVMTSDVVYGGFLVCGSANQFVNVPQV